jgi:hypothetical protein
MIIVDAIEAGISEELTIELMVEEGLPRDACPEILRVFQEVQEVYLNNQKEYV